MTTSLGIRDWRLAVLQRARGLLLARPPQALWPEPDEYDAYLSLAHDHDALSRHEPELRALAQSAGPTTQLYAALLLFHLDATCGRELLEMLAPTDARVVVCMGDGLEITGMTVERAVTVMLADRRRGPLRLAVVA